MQICSSSTHASEPDGPACKSRPEDADLNSRELIFCTHVPLQHALKSTKGKGKMPRTCTICKNKQCDEINEALIQGESFRAIAGQYAVSKTSLQRHKTNHLPVHLLQAKKANELADANTLVEQLQRLEGDARRIAQKAELGCDFKSALMAIREQARLLEIRGRILGEIRPADGGQTTINRITRVDIKAVLREPESRKALQLLADKVEGTNNG